MKVLACVCGGKAVHFAYGSCGEQALVLRSGGFLGGEGK